MGGCRCGAIRLRAYGRPDASAIYCHCRDCRKLSGAPVSLFAGYGSEQVETEQGTPKVYESSPGVRRSFCGVCGTLLSYEAERLPGKVYVLVGAFDEAESFEPQAHDWSSQKPGWLDIPDDLPRYRKSSKPR